MALIYNAELVPSKLELLTPWVTSQPWSRDVDAAQLQAVGAYRFDDPAGEVGIETHLLRAAGGENLHVPVTYRGAPLPDAEGALVGKMEHSVLGPRWVYDGCGDPVYVNALLAAVLTGGAQAEIEIETDGRLERRPATTQVRGSGAADAAPPTVDAIKRTTDAADATVTLVRAGDYTVAVRRVVDRSHSSDGTDGAGETLVGSWPGHDEPTVLATVHRN